MSGAIMSVQTLRDNVAKSRGHIEKQHAIIARLHDLGSKDQAATAAAVLVTMNGHLELEITMLARREADEPGA